MNQVKIDAVRTVGQLLLAHPYAGSLAADGHGNAVEPEDTKACKFCYVGACLAVGKKLHLDKYVYFYLSNELWYLDQVSALCDEVLDVVIDGKNWDSATPKQRKAWAQKLADFEG